MKRTNNEDSLEEFYSGEIEEGSVSILSNKSPSSGKLLLIDQSDFSTHHIFFNDVAGKDETKNEVDVRDVITGEEITHKKYINKYVAHVDPFRAITESDYFVKLIEKCESTLEEYVRICNLLVD
jgi:hypothetical protein